MSDWIYSDVILRMFLIFVLVVLGCPEGTIEEDSGLGPQNISYPCPNQICNCYPRQSPNISMDVVCGVHILTEDKVEKFAVFNDTTVPSKLLLLCDGLDLRFSRLSDGMFESLHAFYYIKIKDCHITHVSKEAFRGLNSLTTLVIEGGQDSRAQIDNDCLQLPELANLEEVSITNTGMVSGPSLCNLDKLWYVNLTGNSLRNFESTGMVCNKSSNIEVIVISDNPIRFLPKRLADVTTELGLLNAANSSIYLLEPMLFEGLENVQIVNLNDNSISSIPPGLFGNNLGIHTLELANNTIGLFAENTLSKLEELTLLRLDGMSLDDRVWTQLENMTKLQVLYLNDNKIQNINADIMHNLRRLGILEMSNNKLTGISNGAFESQMIMILLTLAKNNIVSVEKDSFKGLWSLQTLDLKENDIGQMHRDSLSHLVSMQILNASSNHLTTLPKFPASLVALDLRDNRVVDIDNTSFANLAALQGINIMYNSLTQIKSQTFKANAALKLLNMAYNNIFQIDYDAFGSKSMLETLVLHHNNISSLSFLRYTEFKFLKTIDLSHNKIVALNSGSNLFDESMQEIFLSNNEISFIEGYTFSKSSKLHYVDLKSNKISTLSNLALEVADGNLIQVNFLLSGNPFFCDCRLSWLRNMLDLQNRFSLGSYTIRDLTSLYCSGMGLMKDISIRSFLCEYTWNCFDPVCNCCDMATCSCRHICPDNCTCFRSTNWDDVNVISCTNRMFSSVPGNISFGATILDLSGNNLGRIIPENFTDLLHLEELYLNNSHISEIKAGSFKHFPKLVYLDLSYNSLQTLFPEMFEGLGNLQALSVRFNSIDFIAKKTFHSLEKLEALDISGNELQTISGDEFGKLSTLNMIWLGNNPWSCECSYLVDMKNFTLTTVDRIVDFKEVSCTQFNNSVEELQRYPLVDIHLPEFCRNETVVYNHTRHETVRETLDTASISVMATMLSLFVIGLVIFGLAFWHRDFLKVWLFVKFGWKFNFGKNIEEEDRIYDAFVSYSSKDEGFVVNELVPHLEDGHAGGAGFRLCVHFRDFPVGASIAESIISAVENSKRVLIILSNNFLSSEWCQYEFQTAHHRLLAERKNRIIMILLHDIKTDLLDNELRDYMKTRTYVKYGDPWFWPKIEYAMPKLKNGDPQINIAMENVEPDVIPKGIEINPKKGQRKDSLNSDISDNMKYIIDNMKNFEVDDPKPYAKIEIEIPP